MQDKIGKSIFFTAIVILIGGTFFLFDKQISGIKSQGRSPGESRTITEQAAAAVRQVEYNETDSDNDGLYDWEEILLGTDPLDPKSNESSHKKEETKNVEYIVVNESCASDYSGTCVNVRSGPGVDYPVVSQLRQGVVLKTIGKVTRDGTEWYKIIFDEWLRYPERLTTDWYVAAEFVESVMDEGKVELEIKNQSELDPVNNWSIDLSEKYIVVDRSDQKMYAYEGEDLVMEEVISTGLELSPTPLGTFKIYRKTPSRYMQGPILGVNTKIYDLPGVPWNLYFSRDGAVIHGAYWHNNFGQRWSSGCVNLPPEVARKVYEWAEVGMNVVIQD